MKISKEGILSIENISEVGITYGLLAYYPFNTSANDYSGTGYHGTVSNATLVAGLNALKAYSFNGVSSYIKVEPSFTGGISELSVGCWMQPRSGGSNYRCAIHKAPDTTIGGSEYWIGISQGGYITATIGAKETAIGWDAGETNISAVFGQWYFVIATWDGSVVKVYVDGDYILQYNLPSLTTISRSTRFGASDDGSLYIYSGNIQDARFFNRALTLQEINVLYHTLGETENKMKYIHTNNTLYVKRQFKETLQIK